jgi:sterol desaturase/sphingolipid hydroxylase (fatty acid hydroxylase superfamily)
MFETPLIERFSRTHPLAPFVFWTPFLFYFLYRTHESGVFIPLALALIVAGALLWSLTEYLLHRFLFHRISPTASGRRFHFVLHGVHHDFPTDTGRLVMPLGVSIPIGVVIYLALFFTLGRLAPAMIDPVFVGFGIGYLAYDGIHYATHHFKMERGIARWLKRYHMVHHHTGEEARWGVSSPLWDFLLGTMGRERKTTETVVG